MEFSVATFAHGSFKITRQGIQDSANGSDDPKKGDNIKDFFRRSGGDTYVREYLCRVSHVLNQLSRADSKCSTPKCARLIMPSKVQLAFWVAGGPFSLAADSRVVFLALS